MPDPVIDRRRKGVQTVKISDGNGGELNLVTATFRQARFVLAMLIAIGTIFGGVFIAVRVGIGYEIHAAIKTEAREDGGIIQAEIRECTEEYIEEIQGVIQDDLDDFDKRMKSVEEGQADLRTGQHVALVKLDDHQEEIRILFREAIEREGPG
jgi:hypothetical protein